MNTKLFREKKGISVRTMAEAMKPVFPGMDAPLLAKTENPDRYGVQLTREAEWLIRDSFQELPCREVSVARQPDGHRLKERVSCRVATGSKQILIERFRQDGFKDVNEGLNHLINQYLFGKEM